MFGFRARLKNERFRLEGLYRSGGREYIMTSRWHQIPRINITNANPGIEYDWDAIFTNLRDIYAGERTPVVR